jgi:aldehyde:ferredoxin oxidoreductase
MTAPRGGYFGKILEIDLSTKKFKTRTIPDEVYRKYIGGSGLGAYFLYTDLKPNTDPRSKENFIFMGTGPLNGTYCPATRLSIAFKSPYTGIYGHSEVGGNFGNEIKWAGWDGFLIKGKSPEPVWLYIHNDKVEFRDAKPTLWGKDTYATNDAIIRELKDTDVRTIVIGPAGENQVNYSAMIVDRFRAAGRSGGGTLMGSKNLKAVAVKGTGWVPVADRDKFHDAAKKAKKLAVDLEAWQGIKRWGTAGLLELKNFVSGSLVTKNYQTTWYPDIVEIGGEQAGREFWKRHQSCPNCPVHCMKVGVIRGGDYSGLIAEAPEFETGTMLGANCGVADFDPYVKTIEMCDAMGVDTISMGNVLGYTMELIERGILSHKDVDGVKLEWGEPEAMVEMIRKVAHKEGKGGKLLALGVKQMGEKIGKGADYYAIHVKGQELAAHDPRGDKGRGYSYALGQRGGCQHEGTNPKKHAQWAMLNSLVMCSFVGGYPWGKYTPDVFTAMLNPLCGWNMTGEEYWTTGKRIITLERCYNRREAGVSRKDDVLPKRLMTEKLPEGPKKGAVVSQEEMKKMQDDYYAYFSWGDDGLPTKETLKNLGLEFAIS